MRIYDLELPFLGDYEVIMRCGINISKWIPLYTDMVLRMRAQLCGGVLSGA